MSFSQVVLLVIVIFIFITFSVGAADPAQEALFQPGLAPVVDLVMSGE